MQNVSNEYKEAMKQTIRNRSSMVVAIGDVNVVAQLSAEEAERSDGAYFSTAESTFKNDSKITYSTLEQDFTPVDGTMLFVPRQTSEAPILNNGFVSSGFMQVPADASQTNFLFLFDEVLPPLSVTIEFDDDYPDYSDFYFLWDNDVYWGWVDSPITSKKKTVTATTGPSGATKVKGLWMRGKANTADYRRMRIKSVTMGTGVMIQPDIIESSDQTYYVSRINENLPTSDFRLNLVNYDSRYDADNPDNPLAILDDGKQTVNVYYGYDVDGQGNYEWVHGGKLLSDSWSSGKHRATVMAKDVLQNNENLFIHSNESLRTSNTASDWAALMFTQLLGIDHATEYVIDSDMDNIIMDLPFCRTLPAKQALQLLANYCCKTFFFDADGVPHISSDDNTPELEITANDIIDDITVNKEELIKEVVVPYYTAAFIPTEKVTLFDENVVIPSDGYVFKQDFGGTIYGYVDVMIKDPVPMVTETDLVQYSTNRVATLVQNVTYGEWYELSVDNDKYVYCIYEFDSNSTQINTIIVDGSYYQYTPSSSSVALARVFIRYPNDGAIVPTDVTEFEMSRIEFNAGTNEPVDYWWNVVDHQGTYRVIITSLGYWQFTGTNVAYQVNDSGKSLVWDNPLIGTQDRALAVAEYIGEYLRSNINYNYKYRGNPELDCNDVILQANDFVPNMQVVVSEHKIGFNGALSGEITARRRISE